MRQLRFTGFRKLCEEAADYQDQEKNLGHTGKGDFQKSNMDGVKARQLNIIPGKNDYADMLAGGNIDLTGDKLKKFNKMMGFEDDAAMKKLRIIKRNDYGVQVEDVTGACDNQGLNQGRDGPGTFASRPNVHAPCSPTNGRKWWISAKDWDFVRMPLPPGGGAAGGGGGMGMPGGGPPGGGAPPPGGGGAAPPPPPG